MRKLIIHSIDFHGVITYLDDGPDASTWVASFLASRIMWDKFAPELEGEGALFRDEWARYPSRGILVPIPTDVMSEIIYEKVHE